MCHRIGDEEINLFAAFRQVVLDLRIAAAQSVVDEVFEKPALLGIVLELCRADEPRVDKIVLVEIRPTTRQRVRPQGYGIGKVGIL